MDSEKKLLKKGDREKNQHIQVVLRARPMNQIEKKLGAVSLVTVNPEKKEVIVREKANSSVTKTFTFDKVFGPQSKQTDIYQEVVVPILEEVLMGYNCTIFAYGQTGTGKTFTMEGERSSDQLFSWKNDPLSGIIPRTLHNLFDALSEQHADFTVRVSFVELYNEELFDLLTGVEDAQRLRLYDDPVRKGSVVIHGLEEVIVRNKDEVYEIMEKGTRKRQTAATLINAQSSRSHSVFSITVHIRETTLDGEELLKTGKLYLVDLAGSENIGRSGAVDKRAREAGNINQSLLTLGRVITALVEHTPHVPYRESKLTRLLQDSLGGRTKTSIIATVSPSSTGIDETLSTLDYAFRAKNITNRPEVNQKLTKKAIMKEYAEEIERLRRDLQATREKCGIYIDEENYNQLQLKIVQQADHVTELSDKIEAMQDEYEKISNLFADTQKRLQDTSQQLNDTKDKYLRTRRELCETAENLHHTSYERDERGFLVESHVQKEQLLFTQAQQLMDVGQRAASNLNFLHGKLERKEALEQKNLLTVQQFRNFLVGQVDRLNKNMDAFTKNQAALIVKQKGELDALILKSHNTLDGTMYHVNDTKSWICQNIETLTKNVTEQLLSRLHLYSTHENEIQIATELARSEAAKFSSQITEQLLNPVKQNAANMNAWIFTVGELFVKQAEENTDLLNNFAAECKNSANQLKQSVDFQRTTQEKTFSEISGAWNRACEQQQHMADQVQQIQSMLNSLQVQQKNLLDEDFAKIMHLSTSYNAGEEDTTRSVDQYTERVRERCDNIQDAQCQRNVENAARIEQTVETGRSLNFTLSSLHDKLGSEIHSFSESFTKNHEWNASKALDRIKKLTEVDTSSVDSAVKSLNSIVEQQRSGATLIKNELKSVQEDVASTATAFERHNADFERNTEEWSAEQTSIYETLSSNAETCLSEKLARYKPTGETPARQNFSFPNSLAVTSPHETLLKRFRQQNPVQPFEFVESDKENEAGE